VERDERVEPNAHGEPAPRATERPDSADRTAAPQVVRRGTGIMPAVVLGIVLAAATVVFVVQNQDRVDVDWLWFDFRVSPGALVLVTVLLAIVADEVIGLLVRRYRRRRLDEREELARLRGRTDAGTG
jgi:uncharacterized integral membrane protein